MIRPYLILPVALLGLVAAASLSTVPAQGADKLTNVQGTNCNCTAPQTPVSQAAPASDALPQAAGAINYSTDKRTAIHGTNSNISVPEAPAIVAQKPR